MSYGDRNNKLSRFASSSSIASTVSSASSASSVPTTVKVVKRANPGSFSKRIYESKEEDLSEYVDSAYRNIIAYQYCLLANKEAKLKAKQEELRDSQQRLQAQFAHYSQIQEQNVKKRNALRELQLLKSAIGTGNEIKQFSESVEFLCRDSIPLMISNEEFDQLRDCIKKYTDKFANSVEYERACQALSTIENLDLEDRFISKVCDGQMYEKIKLISKQCDESNRKLFDLKQSIDQYTQLLEKLKK